MENFIILKQDRDILEILENIYVKKSKKYFFIFFIKNVKMSFMKKIKIVIQGLKGSYSHQAVKNIFKKNKREFELVEAENFEDAFEKIKKYKLGLIPVENSTAGFVEQSIRELVSGEFEIIGEYFLPVNHSLLGLKNSGLRDIKKVFSHQQ
jgi:prephenate dehydratase